MEARKHSQQFRRAAAEGIDKLGGSAQADIISKHFQIVKLELEAVLKLERWDELDDLFDQCWKYKSPDHYETLADLVLVIHSCIVQAGVDGKYQKSEPNEPLNLDAQLTDVEEVLSVLHKIVNLTSRQTGTDLTKLSRWLRCLFNLSLTYDESTSLKCIEQVVKIATKQQGVSPFLLYSTARPIVKPYQDRSVVTASFLNTPPPTSDPIKDEHDAELTDEVTKEADRYPQTELEWLATTTFNHGVDYYVQGDENTCKKWAEHAFILAQWLDDNGALRDLLMEKFASLGLQDRNGEQRTG